MMNEMKQKVRDELEDLYWTLAPNLSEKSKDEIDQLMCKFRTEVNEIIEKDSEPVKKNKNNIKRLTSFDSVKNTSLRGFIKATQRELESVFGTPTSEILGQDKCCPDGKTTVEFWLNINGEVVTIYDWKLDKEVDPDEPIVWNVGGDDFYPTDQLIEVGFDQDRVWTRAEYREKLLA